MDAVLDHPHTVDHIMNIEFLDEKYYVGTRDTLTPEKLKALADMSLDIPEPHLYGLYRDELHYAKTLDLMLSSTTQTQKTGMLLKKTILPMLQKKDALLDIGSGDGQITSWIGNTFKHITVVDTNKEILNALNNRQKIFKSHISLEKIHASIVDAALVEERYDLGLLLHILYYIPPGFWDNVIQKMYRSLKPGGILLIALTGDNLGKSELIRHYGGTPPELDSLTQRCVKYYHAENVQNFASKETFITLNLTAMLHIAGILLNDVGLAVEKADLVNYITHHFRKENGSFELTFQQDFIVIHKT